MCRALFFFGACLVRARACAGVARVAWESALVCSTRNTRTQHANTTHTQHLSPSLGVEIPARDYAADCDLLVWRRSNAGQTPSPLSVNWPALRGTLLDEFVLAHALGWWGKALAVRNGPMLWAISVLFELCELSLAVSWL